MSGTPEAYPNGRALNGVEKIGGALVWLSLPVIGSGMVLGERAAWVGGGMFAAGLVATAIGNMMNEPPTNGM